MFEMLTIIDMQLGFGKANCDRIAMNIRDEVQAAKEKQMPILVVEFMQSTMGSTRCDIIGRIGGYDKYNRIQKQRCNGEYEIYHHMKKIGMPFDDCIFNICGVNFDQCVYETARGLWEQYAVSADRLNILEHCSSGYDHVWARESYQDFATVEYDHFRDAMLEGAVECNCDYC